MIVEIEENMASNLRNNIYIRGSKISRHRLHFQKCFMLDRLDGTIQSLHPPFLAFESMLIARTLWNNRRRIIP